MAQTPSNMLPIGTMAPNFTLVDTVSDQTLSLSELRGPQGTIVAFICNHCPFVVHVNSAIVQLANDYKARGIHFIAISSNDVINYPQDGPALMKIHAREQHYPFPYLYDATQEVAKAYDAACTPDFYLFDKALALVYRGQLDDSRPGNGVPVTGKDLRNATNALLNATTISELQKPSIGCNIKWKQF